MELLRQNIPPVYIVGGNMTSRLNEWLGQIGVIDFLHFSLDVRSIDPNELRMSAVHLRNELLQAKWIISVGTFADKVLTMAHLDHGTLPSTTTRDKKVILAQIKKCQEYLNQRSLYYASRPEWPGPSSS